jgi:hypothetical protein
LLYFVTQREGQPKIAVILNHSDIYIVVFDEESKLFLLARRPPTGGSLPVRRKLGKIGGRMCNKYVSIYFFIFFVFLSSCLLAIMIPLSTEQLTKDADVVLIGEVTNVKSYWNKDKTAIYTKAAIYVYRVLVGNIEHSTSHWL